MAEYDPYAYKPEGDVSLTGLDKEKNRVSRTMAGGRNQVLAARGGIGAAEKGLAAMEQGKTAGLNALRAQGANALAGQAGAMGGMMGGGGAASMRQAALSGGIAEAQFGSQAAGQIAGGHMAVSGANEHAALAETEFGVMSQEVYGGIDQRKKAEKAEIAAEVTAIRQQFPREGFFDIGSDNNSDRARAINELNGRWSHDPELQQFIESLSRR